MISHESSKNHETSKFSLSNKHLEKRKMSSSHSRSDFFAKNKYKPLRKKELRRKSNISHFVTRIKGNKTNKLYEIFEEEKGENLSYNNMENHLIRKPKKSLKDLCKIASKRFNNKYNKYYTETKIMTSDKGIIRPNFYGYYQINDLLEHKHCKIKVYYDEFNIYFDEKENLADFLNIKQSYNLLRFILSFLKGNNIYNLNEKNKNKYKSYNFRAFIKIMLNKLNKNLNYKNSILSKIIDQIKEINSEPNKSNINSDSFNEVIDYIKINNILESESIIDLTNNEYTKYLPILVNIPIIFYHCILPNYFCFGYKINILIQNYVLKKLNEVKFEKIENGDSLDKKVSEDESNERTKCIKDKINSYSRLFNDSILRAKGISFANKDNLEENLNDKPIWSFFIKKKKKEENRRSLYDSEIVDIQNFVDNIIEKKETKRKVIVSFQVGIKKEKKGKDALKKKVIENNNKNTSENIPLKLKNSRNNDKIIGILKQKKNNEEDEAKKDINSKYIFNYNYKNNIKGKESKRNISQIISKKTNINNSYDKTKSSKIITQYNTKYSYHKKYVNSLSDTKNTSTNIPNNQSSNLLKIKHINKLNNVLYNSSIISTGRTKKNNSMKKSQSARIINKKNYNFKDSKEFLRQNIMNYKKFNFNQISLKNIEIFGLNKNLKDFFEAIKHIYNFPHLKSEDIEENVWKNGMLKERNIKLDYNYNKLMNKIQKKYTTVKKRNIYKNLLDKNFYMTNVSKRDDIYL